MQFQDSSISRPIDMNTWNKALGVEIDKRSFYPLEGIINNEVTILFLTMNILF